MKHLVFRWLGLVILLSLSVGLQSCMELIRPRGCEKPSLDEYHYGWFDSIPFGTQAVFESNTGKLDTAIYGEIRKREYTQNIGGGQGRCEIQNCKIHYEAQTVNFNNKFGLQEVSFIGISNDVHYGGNKLIKFLSTVGLTEDYDTLSGFNQSFDILGHRYDSCASCSFESKDTNYGRFIYSKRRGLVLFSYKSGTSLDTVFRLKYFITR